ncbi:MAG: alpha/beta hydrolase [Anaerolineales bacterium]
MEGSLFHESARRYGFRLIATERPGMGQSTVKPKRKLLDYPADICELANALGIDKFGVMG